MSEGVCRGLVVVVVVWCLVKVLSCMVFSLGGVRRRMGILFVMS